MRTTYLLSLLAVFLIISPLLAQEEVKFGKVTASDLAMTELAIDTSADAYVLYDLSDNRFEYNNGGNLVSDYHRRVKLLKRSSFDRADHEIYVYQSSQRLSKLKAAIHLPGGKTIELKGRDIIKDDATEDYRVYKFTFPQVTEGAIIEYSYTITSENITSLPKYVFQESVPVRWAEYRINIPEYYSYVSLSNTAAQWHVDDSERVNGQFAGQPCMATQMRKVLKDLPAYKDEPYNNNFQDYLPQVSLQLSSIQYPRQQVQPILKNWREVAKELDEWDYFGRAFNNRGDIKKVLADLEKEMATATTEREKVEVAYRGVTTHMNWNEEYSYGAAESLNKCWERATGTSGELNLILLGVLREMGIQADPVLVSLRDRGAHVEFYPIVSQFDHSMVLAIVDGEEVILDAGSPYRPMGLPRFRALNHRGWVADPERPRWIDITVPLTSRTVMATIDLDEKGMGKTKIQTRLNGYYGYGARESLAAMDDDNEGPLVGEVLEVIPDAEFISREIKKTEEPYSPLNMTVEMDIPLGFVGDDYLYVTPILVRAITKGLADNDQRYTPIDMGYGFKERYIARINLPEGYQVEEFPQPTRVRTEDNALSCSLITSTKPGEVTFNFTVEVNRPLFAPNEYQGMREIFKVILDLQDSQLVLRRVK